MGTEPRLGDTYQSLLVLRLHRFGDLGHVDSRGGKAARPDVSSPSTTIELSAGTTMLLTKGWSVQNWTAPYAGNESCSRSES